MMRKIRKMLSKLTDKKGFTLVEMAIVLIIIGIIIGAVVKGKDLVRGAEQKKFYSKFINEWRLAYLNFYDRTGKILGDTWDTTLAVPGVGQDGQAESGAGTAAYVNPGGNDDLVDGDAADPPAYLGLTHVGIDSPVTNTNFAWQYKYLDSQGTSHFVEVYFQWSGTYNYMAIDNLPTELARSLDAMIDGESDGSNGDFQTATSADWQADPVAENDDVRWRMKF